MSKEATLRAWDIPARSRDLAKDIRDMYDRLLHECETNTGWVSYQPPTWVQEY